MTARYTSCPPRSLRSGAVLGRSSTENDPDAQAISRTPVPIRAADRDLLSLSKGQIVAGVRLEARRWHAANVTEPARSHRRRHTGLDAGILTRGTACDRLPGSAVDAPVPD
jgi:hypothetical protein